jgi:hypothetical protein
MEDRKIKVQNRDYGVVGYTIPDLNNLRRTFQPNEVKYIDFDELFKLYQVPGGAYIIENYLIINDDQAIEELIGGVEPEYYYTEAEVVRILKEGSIDEFEDCLNFAPKGVIDLIKDISVKLPLNDIAKRDMIFKKTGFNVTNAIEISKMDEPVENVDRPTRKAATPARKTEEKVVRKVVKKTTE